MPTDKDVIERREIDALKARRTSILRQLQELETDAALCQDTVTHEGRADVMATIEAQANAARHELEG